MAVPMMGGAMKGGMKGGGKGKKSKKGGKGEGKKGEGFGDKMQGNSSTGGFAVVSGAPTKTTTGFKKGETGNSGYPKGSEPVRNY